MPLAPQHLRTFFITSATASRRRLFQIHQNATLLIEILELQRQQNRIQLHAFVIMPDHIHLLLTPAPDLSLEKAIQYIKGGFSFRLKDKLDVWQRSYTNHRIASPDDYTTHIAYIHHNPIKERLATEPHLYPYSSATPHALDPPPSHLQTPTSPIVDKDLP